MDWLKKLPVIGPVVVRLMATHVWRAYERLDRVKWSRLAAALTFISFVALFPLLTVAAAVGAATLSTAQQNNLQSKIADQFPGLSSQLDIHALVQNAGTVGVIAGAVLLVTGVNWVGQVRDCLRAVWELPDGDENPLLRKLKDAGVLLGLGGAVLVTLATSTIASALVGWLAGPLGLDQGGWGTALLRVAAFAVSVLTDFLLLLYVLTLLPGVEPPRRRLVTAALIGAIGFELLKVSLSGYLQGVAAKSMYGAFGVPVALLLWINLMARLVLFCAAWTATRARNDPVEGEEPVRSEEDAQPVGDEETETVRGGSGGAPDPAADGGDGPGRRPPRAGRQAHPRYRAPLPSRWSHRSS
ncbi:YihY/virulence factor BrkB family protein [Streptomyces sp. RY43-2]|uniref:YihY/virulence factor BrkB family protein n=1 Tax=Streptomyces macrolidinus TaxID=2952607 RepID=A0ABT0ZKX8_9ACTN|nr:YihY/virulence factor BrkB family protein [Streptomyces macrolidinus]MCN9244237.1 YihY/virulence factor BrkB family protein [Streptomyces macrolidinus]